MIVASGPYLISFDRDNQKLFVISTFPSSIIIIVTKHPGQLVLNNFFREILMYI